MKRSERGAHFTELYLSDEIVKVKVTYTHLFSCNYAASMFDHSQINRL